MDIKQIEQGSKGAFVIEEGSERLAEMTYSKAGEKIIIIDHTDVSDRLRGTGNEGC
jgi:predicted GNAT family acetyltransferase